MSASKEVKYVKAYVARMLALNRAIEWQVSRTNSEFNLLNKQVIAEIKRQYPDVAKMSQINALNASLKSAMGAYFFGDAAMSLTNSQAYNQIIDREIVWASNNLTLFAGTEANTANSVVVANRAAAKTYQGHTFDFWYKTTAQGSTKRVLSMVKDGYVRGKTTSEVVADVSNLMNKTGSEVRTLTRSYLQHAAVEARQETFNQNADLIAEYIWISVLDGRTTVDICGIRDSKRYDVNFNPIDSGLPWGAGPGRIHFNCRSSYIPRLVGQQDIRDHFTRPATNAGPNYSKGDMKTRTGKVRKPTKANRENGIFDITQVSSSTTYEDYLRRQKLSFINDVIKNKQLAADFQSGKISLYEIAMQGTIKDVNKL